ncbi:MAG: T9SS type A sorting domain-containing protein [Bacteroidetes bacterium]|nr:T9SS type A sorting domain-containing protein [Bacteroidota bacterium]
MKTKQLVFTVITVLITCIWAIAQNKWIQKHDFGGMGRAFAAGFSIGDKGYVGTGDENFGISYNDFWEFNPAGTSIDDRIIKNFAYIYPNPFSNRAVITLRKEIQGDFKIFDVQGKEIGSQPINGNKIIVDRGNLAKGNYQYNIIVENIIISAGELLVE